MAGRTTAESISTDAGRQRILEIASDLLARSGPAALTVRDVAAAAGSSTMMIYTLFGGKQLLLEAVYADGFERLQAALSHCAEEPDAVRRLRGLARAYRLFGLAHPALYAAMFSRPIASARLRGTRGRRETPSFTMLADAVLYGYGIGTVKTKYPNDTVADSLWAAVHGHVSLEASGHFAEDADVSSKRFETLVDIFLTGLSARAAVSPALAVRRRRS